MFSINSLNGNSFFDVALQYQKMAIRELGDESFNAPIQMRDIEKSSLSTSGDDSFIKFVGSFSKLHSIITTYVYKRDSNASESSSKVGSLKTKIDDINEKKASEMVRGVYLDDKVMFDELEGEIDDTIISHTNDLYTTDFDEMKKDIIELIDDKIDTRSKEETIVSYSKAFDVLAENILKFRLRSNSTLNAPFKNLSDYFESIRNNEMGALIESLRDKKDDAILDAEADIDKSRDRDQATGVIGELNSLSDAALISSDLYETINKNIGVWNTLIKSNDITLKKGDVQGFKIKEDSSEIVEILSQEKYIKEDQKVFKKVLKSVKSLNQLIQQLGSNSGGDNELNNHQFIGNASYPSRMTPSTGVNTNQVMPQVQQVQPPQPFQPFKPPKPPPPKPVQTESHKQDMAKIKTYLEKSSNTKAKIAAATNPAILKEIGFVLEKAPGMRATSRKQLVDTLFDFYYDFPDDANDFVKSI